MTEPYRSSAEAMQNRELIYSDSYRGQTIEIFRHPAWEADGELSAEALLLRVNGARERFRNGEPPADLEEAVRLARQRIDLMMERG